jgi:hypothetical protein
VISSALTLIYRELQRLDANLIARNLDGSYHMSVGSSSTTSNSWGQHQNLTSDKSNNNGLRRVESDWAGGSNSSGQDSSSVGFAIPDFSDFDIPSDFFSMLPELEPISANVGAGFEIDLDKPWY